MEELKSKPKLSVSAKTAFLFFASVMLVYFVAGAFIQASLGLLGIFLNQILFVGLPVIIFSQAQGLAIFDWPSWKTPHWKEILLSLLGIIVLSLLIDRLIEIQDKHFPPPPYLREFFEELTRIKNWKEGIVKTIALALTPAFCEEIFFRGFLLPSWAQKFGKVWGNIFTSLAFAIAHGNLLYFHYYFILGIYLGWLYQKRNCLWLPILAHFANNARTLFSPN